MVWWQYFAILGIAVIALAHAWRGGDRLLLAVLGLLALWGLVGTISALAATA